MLNKTLTYHSTSFHTYTCAIFKHFKTLCAAFGQNTDIHKDEPPI